MYECLIVCNGLISFLGKHSYFHAPTYLQDIQWLAGQLKSLKCRLLIHRVISLNPKSPFNKGNRWQTALQTAAGFHTIFDRSLWCQEKNLHRKVGLFVPNQDSITGHGVKSSLDLKINPNRHTHLTFSQGVVSKQTSKQTFASNQEYFFRNYCNPKFSSVA